MQPILDVHSRDQEESQIAVKWFGRLQSCLRDESPRLFDDASKRFHISREQLSTGEGLTHSHFDQVLDHICQTEPDTRLRFMSELELLDLGMLGYAILSCPTVGKGLELASRYITLTSDRFTEEHILEEGFHVIRPQLTWRHLTEEKSIAEDCIGGNWKAIQLMSGSGMDFYGAVANFTCAEPKCSESYETFFGPCTVHFNAQHNELKIPEPWLSRSVSTGNVLMSDMTSAMCERLLGPGTSTRLDTARAVRRLLLSRPGQRMLRLEEAADAMSMSTAQLRKRLYRAGTSYKSIVLEVRMGLARHYLESTHLSVQEIAYLLDYSQPGPFSRAFKKFFGQSPRGIRNNPAGAVGAPP